MSVGQPRVPSCWTMSDAATNASRSLMISHQPSTPMGVPAGCRRSRYNPSDSLTGFGGEPCNRRIHSSQGAGARARLITHRSELEVLHEDDCTFTTAQSPSALDVPGHEKVPAGGH